MAIFSELIHGNPGSGADGTGSYQDKYQAEQVPLIVLAGAAVVLPEAHREGPRRSFDIPGAALAASGKDDTLYKNSDRTWNTQTMRVTYAYDGLGRVTGASGVGQSESDDGFDNLSLEVTAQTYRYLEEEAE